MAIELARIFGIMLVPFGALLATEAMDVERWVGGGIIVAAGIFLVRWSLKTSERVESTYVQALSAANNRAERCEKECVEMRQRYEAERTLRMQLEQHGITDRRHDPRGEK